MRENEIIKGQCVDLSHDGLGIIKVDNCPIFVDDLLVDEVAQVTIVKEYKNYALGKIIKRFNDSDERVNPKCSHFNRCGGCDLMHMNYKAQLNFKIKMVNETFKRIGHLDFMIKDIIGADNPYEYRNKVQIPYQFNGKKVICGFYRKKSHIIEEVADCYIQSKLTTDIARFVRNLLNEYHVPVYSEDTHDGVFRHLLVRKTFNDEYMVVMICQKKKFEALNDIVTKIKNRYSQVKSIIINYNNKTNNVILGDDYKVLYGKSTLVENILGLSFNMSFKSFFQINHEQTEKLYSKVLEFAGDYNNKNILDCYCGVGTMALLFARSAKKVFGIEIISEAIDDAKKNVLLNKDLLKSKIKFMVGKAEELIDSIDEAIDILICDPPRKGMDSEMVKKILDSDIPQMIYVSCDCATLARDLSLLQEKYYITKGVCVDLFPQTADVETVVLLEHR